MPKRRWRLTWKGLRGYWYCPSHPDGPYYMVPMHDTLGWFECKNDVWVPTSGGMRYAQQCPFKFGPRRWWK